jgi:hypothetical protein
MKMFKFPHLPHQQARSLFLFAYVMQLVPEN